MLRDTGNIEHLMAALCYGEAERVTNEPGRRPALREGYNIQDSAFGPALCRVAATIVRQKRKFKRTLVCSYTSNVAFCRVLSRFGVFVVLFLACARATGMQVAGGQRSEVKGQRPERKLYQAEGQLL